MKGSRSRIDQALVARGLAPSREKARIAILAGTVRINGRTAEKASDLAAETDLLEVTAPEKYVSRGGLKLEHALTAFQLSPQGVVAMDIGASTGGFTDCLLQHGAARVIAIDVGHGQLAWKLRQDPRVVVRERTNARHLTLAQFPDGFSKADWIVADCSFISLRLILPPSLPFLRPGGTAVALIKPQFEAGRVEVSKGAGVIRDPLIHQRVIDEIREWVQKESCLDWRGITESPILGPAGNKEFLVWLEKTR